MNNQEIAAIAAAIGITPAQVEEIAAIAAVANQEKRDVAQQHQAELDAAALRPNYRTFTYTVPGDPTPRYTHSSPWGLDLSDTPNLAFDCPCHDEHELDASGSFTPYDNNAVPPMPDWMRALWTSIFDGSYDDPPVAAPIWDCDEEEYNGVGQCPSEAEMELMYQDWRKSRPAPQLLNSDHFIPEYSCRPEETTWYEC